MAEKHRVMWPMRTFSYNVEAAHPAEVDLLNRTWFNNADVILTALIPEDVIPASITLGLLYEYRYNQRLYTVCWVNESGEAKMSALEPKMRVKNTGTEIDWLTLHVVHLLARPVKETQVELNKK